MDELIKSIGNAQSSRGVLCFQLYVRQVANVFESLFRFLENILHYFPSSSSSAACSRSFPDRSTWRQGEAERYATHVGAVPFQVLELVSPYLGKRDLVSLSQTSKHAVRGLSIGLEEPVSATGAVHLTKCAGARLNQLSLRLGRDSSGEQTYGLGEMAAFAIAGSSSRSGSDTFRQTRKIMLDGGDMHRQPEDISHLLRACTKLDSLTIRHWHMYTFPATGISPSTTSLQQLSLEGCADLQSVDFITTMADSLRHLSLANSAVTANISEALANCTQLKKNLANKIFGYLARCEF